jgi:hypothetical protein
VWCPSCGASVELLVSLRREQPAHFNYQKMFRVAPQQADKPRKNFVALTARCGSRDNITMRHHRSHFAGDQFVWSCNGLIFRIMFARNRILATSDRDAFAFLGARGLDGKIQNPDDRGAECSDAPRVVFD